MATIWIYSSTLAYIVDANPGRASSAVACNSLFRGVLAAIAAQIANPAIDALGNGWYYTGTLHQLCSLLYHFFPSTNDKYYDSLGFAVILLVGELGLLLASKRGKVWRETSNAKEQQAMIRAKEELKS